MPCRATQDRQVMVECSDKTGSTGDGNGKPLQYSCLENTMNSMKRQKDITLKDICMCVCVCAYIYIYASQVVLVVKIQPPMQETQESRFNAWVGKIPWSRKWQPTPVSWPGESHGQRCLVGYSPWGHKESDMTKTT